MNKIIFAVLSLIIASAIAQDCNNQLTASFNFGTGSLQNGNGLSYCQSLKAGQTCCDNSVIGTFQSKADQMIQELTSTVSARDQFLIKSRNAVYKLKPLLERLGTATVAALTSLLTIDPSGVGLTQDDMAAIMTVANVAQMFSTLSAYLITDVSQFQTNFTEYQKGRSTCIVELVKTQAAVWCLACDPNYATKGVSGTSITLSQTVQDRIFNACIDYISLSAMQNSVITLNFLMTDLSKMVNALESIANGNNNGLAELLSLNGSKPTNGPANNNETPVEEPNGCNESGCDWLFTSLFANGKINQDLLAIGGEFNSMFSSNRRILRNGEESTLRNNRVLQYNPGSDEAGVTVEFEENPGKVNNEDLSALRNGIIACVLSLFLAFIF